MTAKAGAIEWWHCLDICVALGGHPARFDDWIAHPRRTRADAWAQLIAAIKGDLPTLLRDTNPPAGDELLALVEARTSSSGWR